jgi:hypothetical protein
LVIATVRFRIILLVEHHIRRAHNA